MKTKALSLILSIAALAYLAGCQQNQPQEPAAAVVVEEIDIAPSELIINLTSDATTEPESALMGLTFAEKALENGLTVTVFMNVRGVKLASTAAADISINDTNLHGIITRIIEKGGNVVACPMCMKVQGIAETDLMEGIKVSGEGMMMQKLKENPTVFTY